MGVVLRQAWSESQWILYIIFLKVCLYALTLYPVTARMRCWDRYIRCHRLLAVKPLSPREHAGRRVGKGGTLGSVQTTAVLIRPATYDNGLLLAIRDDSKLMYAWCQLTQWDVPDCDGPGGVLDCGLLLVWAALLRLMLSLCLQVHYSCMLGVGRRELRRCLCICVRVQPGASGVEIVCITLGNYHVEPQSRKARLWLVVLMRYLTISTNVRCYQTHQRWQLFLLGRQRTGALCV